jgi:Tc5 transposase DNA-binding domain
MEARLELALTELREQAIPKPEPIARKYDVNITTLRRRFAGTQQSRNDARDETHKRLTKVQEETLISLISDFTERHIPPTSQLVKNFAEELVGGPVGKNWVGRFTARNKDKLHGAYLRNLDASRAKAENPANIKRFYDQVSYIIVYIIVYSLLYIYISNNKT